MKKFMAIIAPIILVGMLGYMIFANPRIPLLDANRAVLVETELQAYCAGNAYQRNEPNPSGVAECVNNNRGAMSDEINLEIVQEAACRGVGTPAANLGACVDFLKGNQYWITRDAVLTNSWNSRFPYPLADNLLTQENNDTSRTGDRDGNSREGLDRG